MYLAPSSSILLPYKFKLTRCGYLSNFLRLVFIPLTVLELPFDTNENSVSEGGRLSASLMSISSSNLEQCLKYKIITLALDALTISKHRKIVSTSLSLMILSRAGAIKIPLSILFNSSFLS